jgi:hypothetical protein
MCFHLVVVVDCNALFTFDYKSHVDEVCFTSRFLDVDKRELENVNKSDHSSLASMLRSMFRTHLMNGKNYAAMI